jgi:DNA-directed RNA polymerase specialized sigma24 family protein
MVDPAPHIPSEAFIRALTESQSALRGYCQASLGHGEEAKEALQRTSIVLWRKCNDWDCKTEFLRWAISVAKYEVLGVIRDPIQSWSISAFRVATAVFRHLEDGSTSDWALVSSNHA